MLVAVHGTWGLSATWWRPESLFMQRAAARGLQLFAEPFFWDGEIGGVAGRGLDGWRAAGAALGWYCRAMGDVRPDVISHSHGIQVVAFAVAAGQTFGRVLDVSGPVRLDLQEAYVALRKACSSWTHVYDVDDSVILEGAVGGGGLIKRDDNPAASDNIDVSGHGYGHSGLFDDLRAWDERGLWRRLGAL